jgi:hypothetical protein
VAGLFDEIGGIAARKLARLNPDGSVDFTFIPPQPNAEVRSVIALPDGRLLIGGAFTKIGNEERRFVAMLKADGSLDPEFDIGAGPDERPGAMSIHADGSLYVPGLLKQFNSLDAASLARVHLGGLPTAITAFELTPRSELKLQASVFPGGTYVIESSPNFTQWSSAGQIKAEGFAREQTTIITQLPGHRFLRLKNAP